MNKLLCAVIVGLCLVCAANLGAQQAEPGPCPSIEDLEKLIDDAIKDAEKSGNKVVEEKKEIVTKDGKTVTIVRAVGKEVKVTHTGDGVKVTATSSSSSSSKSCDTAGKPAEPKATPKEAPAEQPKQ